MKTLAYLAAPYSDPDPLVVYNRMWLFARAGAQLTEQGQFWVSPLSMHPTLEHSDKIGSDWNFWESYSKLLLTRCDLLIVLCLEGWDKSTGVAGEIKFAKLLGIPVKFALLDADAKLGPLRDLPYDSQQPPPLLV